MAVELKVASYKNVEFLFKSAKTTGGVKRQIFSYPNSNRQSIEEFGTAPRSFELVSVIPFEDYENQKASLLRALESGGAGTLVHPTFGSINGVKAGAYTINETITELGRAEVTMRFDIDNAAGIPQQAANSVSQVNQDNQTLLAGLNSNLADNWDISSPNNYDDGVSTAQSVASLFKSASEGTGQIADHIDEYRRDLDNFTDSINQLVVNPTALSNGVGSLFNSLNNLYEAPGDAFTAFKSLFGYGDDDPEINPTTADLAERKKNRDLMRGVMKCEALGYAYVASADTEYQTDRDVDQANDELEQQYLISVAEDISNASVGDLNNIRTQANATLAEIRISARRIITITTKRIPLSVLAYKYYGSTDLVDTLQQLNNLDQISFVEGDVEILTS